MAAELATINTMTDSIKFAVLKQDETVAKSIFRDLVTFTMLSFLIWISQGSTWWTFVTGAMWLAFTLARIKLILDKSLNRFKTKAELQSWVESLEDDSD